MKKLPTRVSEEQWRKAQAWELAHWMKENSFLVPTLIRRLKNLVKALLRRPLVPHGAGDDWNEWWATAFNHYAALPSHLDRAVELGCGPYTNIRKILTNRTISDVHCSDPLAHHYCTFEGRWLAEAAKSGAITVDTHPIEECPYETESFDLVVVINVLDHVRDAKACLDQILRILKKGGFLVFGQDLSNEDDYSRVAQLMKAHGAEEDIGHPIRLHHEFINSILFPSIAPINYRILSRENGRNPEGHYGTYLLIGNKREHLKFGADRQENSIS